MSAFQTQLKDKVKTANTDSDGAQFVKIQAPSNRLYIASAVFTVCLLFLSLCPRHHSSRRKNPS